MKTPEKYMTKGGRISSLMQQDSAYRKPPTPFPDPERVDFGKLFLSGKHVRAIYTP